MLFVGIQNYRIKVRRKTNIRNRYSLIPHLTQDTICESDKITRKHHMQESQEVSPFPASDNKAARNRQDSIIEKHETQIAKRIHRRSTNLERPVRRFNVLEGLNMFEGTNLTLISDVDQNKYMFGSYERSLSYRCIISQYIHIG